MLEAKKIDMDEEQMQDMQNKKQNKISKKSQSK